MINKIKKLNFPLILGAFIVLILTLMCFYPQWFTDRDPTYEEQPKYVEMKVDGVLTEKFLTSPMAPNKENIFGTDDAGRDIYARLIYGARNTLRLGLLVALFRMIFALPMGLAGAMGIRTASWLIKIFNIIFTAIPMVILSFMVLNIQYFKNLPIDKSINAFVVVLTFVGWAKLGGIIEDSARVILEEDFIEGEIAIGKNRVQIAYQNVLPHIIPNCISLFLKEMATALFLLAQLSVLGVFVGLIREVQELAFKAAYVMNLEPEWGGMLSRISRNVKGFENVYWMVVYPILFFTIAILGINLTGEGVRIEFQKRNSKIISNIKKIGYILSPRIFLSQVRNIKTYYKPVLAKVTTVALVCIVTFVNWSTSLYKFDLGKAQNHLRELTSEKYEGRVPGSEGGYLAGEYIINTLEDYGYTIDTMEVPLYYNETYEDENGEIKEFSGTNHMAPTIIKSGEIRVKDEYGKEEIYKLHKDFTIVGVNPWDFEKNQEGRFTLKGVAANLEKGDKVPEGMEFVLIKDGFMGMQQLETESFQELFNDNTITFPSGRALKFKAKILLQEGHDTSLNAYNFLITTIVPFENLRKVLKEGYKEIEITFDEPIEPKKQGRIIRAFLPGKGKTEDNPGEVVLIGTPYDGVYEGDKEKPFAMTAAPTAIALETARNLALAKGTFDKSIEFIFWDNEIEYMEQSSVSSVFEFCTQRNKPVEMANSHGYYYFDITYPGYKGDKKMNLLSIPGSRDGKGNYITTLEIQERLRELNVKFNRLNQGDPVSNAFNSMELNSILSVSFGNYTTEQINSNSGIDNIENINYKTMKNIGQIIIDTVTMNPYMMEENDD